MSAISFAWPSATHSELAGPVIHEPEPVPPMPPNPTPENPPLTDPEPAPVPVSDPPKPAPISKTG